MPRRPASTAAIPARRPPRSRRTSTTPPARSPGGRTTASGDRTCGPDFNRQYYNPAISYRPGVNSDGTEMQHDRGEHGQLDPGADRPLQTAGKDTLGKGMSTADLVANYPDRAWCKNDTDAATDTTNCRVNSAYTYPNWEFNRGITGTGYVNNYANIKYRFGRPYYYRMRPRSGARRPMARRAPALAATASTRHRTGTFPGLCTDPELIDCAAGVSDRRARVLGPAVLPMPAPPTASARRSGVSAGRSTWVRSRPPARPSPARPPPARSRSPR